MTHKWKILFAGLLIYSQAFTSFEIINTNIQSLGRGMTSNGFSVTSDCLFSNPSLLLSTSPMMTLSTIQPYGLEPLNTHSATAVYPFKKFGMGIGIIQLGNQKYRESTFSLGMGIHLSDKINLGFNGRLLHLQIQKYGQASSFLLDFGSTLHLTQNIKILFCATNIFQSTLGKSKEHLPQTTTLSLNYKAMKTVIILVEWFKDVHYPLEIRGGLDLFLFRSLKLRGGFTQNPETFTAGFGWTWNRVIFNYAMQHHAILGMTHGFSISITF